MSTDYCNQLVPSRSPPEWEGSPKQVLLAILSDGFSGLISRNPEKGKLLVEEMLKIIDIK